MFSEPTNSPRKKQELLDTEYSSYDLMVAIYFLAWLYSGEVPNHKQLDF